MGLCWEVLAGIGDNRLLPLLALAGALDAAQRPLEADDPATMATGCEHHSPGWELGGVAATWLQIFRLPASTHPALLEAVMSQSFSKAGNLQRRKPVYAGFLLGLFLSVWGMAQFETIHQAVHCNACKPDHQCAVTMLSSGLVDLADAPCDTVAYSFTVVAETSPDADVSPAVRSLLPFTRGPPAFLT
jgi:hypothetical protein